MKLSAIKRVCMDAKQFCIYDEEDGTQWIGTQNAAYPVGGELFSEANIAEIFDLTEKQSSKVEVRREMWETSYMRPVAKAVGIDRARMTPGLPVCYVGEMMQPLAYRGELYLVLVRDIKAAASNGREYLDYYMDEDAQGEPLVIISDGMLDAGVVRPLPVGMAEGVINWLRPYGELAPGASRREPFPAEDGEEDHADGQIGMAAALEEECAEWEKELSGTPEDDENTEG